MIYSAEARQQIRALQQHYERKGRIEAVRNLGASLDEAERRIEAATPDGPGLRAPRPYPELARPGCAWIKAGRYWVAYSIAIPLVILAVFYEQADIPGRLDPR